MPSSLYLDHIVLLLPYAALLDPPSWLTQNFTLTPGGTHSDNRTANKLIIFADGSYVELIAFVNDDPKHREGHKWDKAFGIVDFALTTTSSAEQNFSEISKRLAALDIRVGYAKPLAGGRLRPDGQEVRWEVTNPTGVARGEIPFFCHDVTERGLRVPLGKQNVEHPSGVVGVESFAIYLPKEKVNQMQEIYGSLFDKEVLRSTVQLGRLKGKGENAKLFVGKAGEEWKEREVESRGGVFLGDLVFGTGKGDGKGAERIDGEADEVGFGGLYIN